MRTPWSKYIPIMILIALFACLGPIFFVPWEVFTICAVLAITIPWHRGRSGRR